MIFKSEHPQLLSPEQIAWREAEYQIADAQKCGFHSCAYVAVYHDNGLWTICKNYGVHAHPMIAGELGCLHWDSVKCIFHATTSEAEAIAAFVVAYMQGRN